MSLFTLYISHTKDPDYLYHFSDIIKRIPFLMENAIINIDGWFRVDEEMPAVRDVLKDSLSIPIQEKTYHNTPHGERCYELIEQAKTDLVFIVDSDFFCCDERLWLEAYNKLKGNPEIYLVSLFQQWNWIPDLPTTPFCGYRKKVLEYVPERKLWNHFGKIWPELKQPVFDFMKFVFLSLYKDNRTYCVDAMNWPGSNLKFKHYHFWDSRDFYEENFANYEREKNGSTTMYMVYGLSKYFFKAVKTKKLETPEFLWEYIRSIKDNSFYYGFIVDFFKNFEDQIYFRPDWVENFKILKKQFTERFPLK